MKKYFFKVSDYLQIACSGKHTVRLIIKSNDKQAGEIIIIDGILWNAFDKKGDGENAFLRLVFERNAEVESFEISDKDLKRSIFMHWEELLIKGAADRDKSRRSENGKMSDNGKKEDLKVVINQGLESIMKRDYKNAINIFKDLNERYPGNLTIKAKLEKLKKIIPEF